MNNNTLLAMSYNAKYITYERACEFADKEVELLNKSIEYREAWIEGFMIGFDEGYEMGVEETRHKLIEINNKCQYFTEFEINEIIKGLNHSKTNP